MDKTSVYLKFDVWHTIVFFIYVVLPIAHMVIRCSYVYNLCRMTPATLQPYVFFFEVVSFAVNLVIYSYFQYRLALVISIKALGI